MARIAGVDIPRDKRVVISLTYVYGIGKSTAKEILKATGISEDVRVKDLTEEEVTKIRKEIEKITRMCYIHDVAAIKKSVSDTNHIMRRGQEWKTVSKF